MSSRRQLLVPATAAGAAAAGFGVLAVFALVTPPVPGLPGLDAFPSAFVGDPLLLPAAVAVLARSVSTLPSAPADRRWAGAGALFGLSGGVVTQLLWLADDRPATNWTLPEPHRFNGAGVWHAVYLCLTSALLCGLAVVVLVRLRRTAAVDRARVEGMVSGPGATLLWMALFSYVALVVHDSGAGTAAAISTLVALAIGAAGCVAVTAVALRGAALAMVRPVLLGVGTAAATAVTVWGAPTPDGRGAALGLSVCLLAGLAIGSLVLLEEPVAPFRAALVAVFAGVVLCAGWIGGARAAAENWVLPLVVAGVQTAVLLLGYRLADGRDGLRRAADAVLALAIVTWIAGPVGAVAERLPAKHVDFIIGVALSAVIFWYLFPTVTRRFDLQMKIESDLRKSTAGALPVGARRRVVAALLFVVSAFLATAAALLTQTINALGQVDYHEGAGWPVLAAAVTGSVGAASVVAALVWFRRTAGAPRRAARRRTARRLAPLLFLPWTASLVGTLDADVLRHSPAAAVVLVATSLLCAWWTGGSLLDNVFLLRARRVDRSGWALVGAGALATAVAAYWAGSQAILGPDQPWATLPALSCAFGVLAVHGTLTVVIGRLAAPPAPTLTQYGLTHNLSQDALVITLLHTFAVATPLVFLVHLGGASGSDQVLRALAVAVPVLTLLGCAYRWTALNNTSHVVREIEARSDDPGAVLATIRAESGLWERLRVQRTAARQGLPGPTRFLRVLGAHAHTQNIIGLWLLVPLVVGVLALIGERSSGVVVPGRD